jgi:hypothetical protein
MAACRASYAYPVPLWRGYAGGWLDLSKIIEGELLDAEAGWHRKASHRFCPPQTPHASNDQQATEP